MERIFKVTLYKPLNKYTEKYWEGENKFTNIIKSEDKETAALKAYKFYEEEFNPEESTRAVVEPMQFEDGILVRDYLLCEDTYDIDSESLNEW